VIKGSCLCGSVTFGFVEPEPDGQFAFCHCNRCRKFSGSAFFAALTALGVKFLSGEDQIRTYEAPILKMPPPYRRNFCGRCGSPVPLPADDQPNRFVVPAGCLDDDPGVRPEGHIWCNTAAPWYEFTDQLPKFSDAEWVFHRIREWEKTGDHRAMIGYDWILMHYPDSVDVVMKATERLAVMRGDFSVSSDN
jgi:hypothetical protein